MIVVMRSLVSYVGQQWTADNSITWCCRDEGSIEDAFLVGLLVDAGSPAIGRSLAGAGLRGLDGLYLTSVKRSATVIHAVGPDFIIMRDDVLFFAGELTKVKSIAQRFRLRPVTDAFEEDLPALMGSPRKLDTIRKPFQADVEPPTAARPSASLVCSRVTAPGVNLRLCLEYHLFPLLQVDSSMALLAADATSQSEIRRQSVMPPTQLMRARVAKDAPDLCNVTVRCGYPSPLAAC